MRIHYASFGTAMRSIVDEFFFVRLDLDHSKLLCAKKFFNGWIIDRVILENSGMYLEFDGQEDSIHPDTPVKVLGYTPALTRV